jgi:hypothetical protein
VSSNRPVPVIATERDAMGPTGQETTAVETTTALRRMQQLVGAYVVLSVSTVVAMVLLRHTSAVTDAVWVRGTIVAVTSVLLWTFARSAARGSGRGLLRVRLVSAIMLVAILVILAIPGDFPVWLKAEQAVCGLVLLGVVLIANSPAYGPRCGRCRLAADESSADASVEHLQQARRQRRAAAVAEAFHRGLVTPHQA